MAEKRALTQDEIARQRAVAALFEMPGWRWIEEVQKAKIRRAYARFRVVRGHDDFLAIQAEIDWRLKILEEVGNLAGKAFSWKGYKDIDEAIEFVDEDIALAQEGEEALSGERG